MKTGDRLGGFEIVAPLGAGGMGEVYRARDTKLNRDVAIKVLPPVFASDPDRLARFEREAQTLASLNHPNIAHIHGVEESGGVRALVIELVDGEDLSTRIARGPVPVREALAIARQIAEALAAAHERGIIHRDLKPANVKLRDDGMVKVLDFGLAKALGSDPAGPSSEAMNSPTLTMRATALGMVIGTAAYMAPEQARGKPVDRRADVWAFGVLLYEMLTGRRAFDGGDISDVLASVLKDAVPLETLPPDTPRAIRTLLRRCLEKDRAKRLDSMAAARLDIDEALTAEEQAPHERASAPVGGRPSRLSRALPWLAATAAVTAIGWAAAARPWADVPPVPAYRLSVTLGMNGVLDPTLDSAVAIAPDGRTLALVVKPDKDSTSRLYLRRLDALTETPLAGTDGARAPFFSPDGRWIGFFAKGKLQKISVNGGAAIVLADCQAARGGAWGEDDVITYAPAAGAGGQLFRIPASGGTPTPVGPMPQGKITQRWPQVLPGNQAILYTTGDNIDSFEDACLAIQPLAKTPPRVLQCGGYGWRYIPTGHVLYIHSGTLFAAPFDVRTMQVGGAGVPVLDGFIATATSGGAELAVAPSGVAIYIAGSGGATEYPLDVVDRSGKATRMPGDATAWETLAYSPDGRRMAFSIGTLNQSDVWVRDLDRSTMTRLTFSDVVELNPIWTPDGRRITYASAQSGSPNLFWKPADGSGPETRLLTNDAVQMPGAWTPDGRMLFFFQQASNAAFDLWILPMEGDSRTGLTPGKPRAFLATPANEAMPTVSPDGRWVAYMSDESGQLQVYVRPVDGSEGKWQVSIEPAVWTAWSPKGPELLFGGSDGRLMFVKYEGSDHLFRASRPEEWTPARYSARGVWPPFALHPDGQRVAMSLQSAQFTAPADRFVMISNFFNDVRSKVEGRR